MFITLYIGLALVLSMTISLFWLVAVVAAHGVLEWFALLFTLTFLVLILLTPVLTQHDLASMLQLLALDLHPWPGD